MSYNTPGYGGYPSTPPGPPPPNHLVWAILTTLFCCLPAGIASIVFAAQVNSKWQSGDYEGAQKSSNNAKTWAIVSAVGGAIFIVIYLVIVVGAASNS
ncbi:CD225/dispanin family protein [Spirillospora sp. NPDC048911]|uniref:CD225/dispanin family protein n=1 Tax=Spirillospora sp. NPDC048911 TaxID=3364527 RepID=UPI003715F908